MMFQETLSLKRFKPIICDGGSNINLCCCWTLTWSTCYIMYLFRRCKLKILIINSYFNYNPLKSIYLIKCKNIKTNWNSYMRRQGNKSTNNLTSKRCWTYNTIRSTSSCKWSFIFYGVKGSKKCWLCQLFYIKVWWVHKRAIRFEICNPYIITF